jgi:hypothetical protein
VSVEKKMIRSMRHGDEAHIEMGWRPMLVNPRSYANPRGWAVLWVVVEQTRADGSVYQYEQPTVIENPGVYVIFRDIQGRVALQQERRLCTDRQLVNTDLSLVRNLLRNDRWNDLIQTFGTWQWQLPRGFPPHDLKVEGLDFIGAFVTAVSRLAHEEIGVSVSAIQLLSHRVFGNTVFDVHPQYIATAEAGWMSHSLSLPEHIRPVQWLFPTQIRKLIYNNELQDARTIAALVAAEVF